MQFSCIFCCPCSLLGEDAIPLTAMVQFVRLCHVYEQREVFEMIVGRVLQATKVSTHSVATHVVSNKESRYPRLLVSLVVVGERVYVCGLSTSTLSMSKPNFSLHCETSLLPKHCLEELRKARYSSTVA